MKHQISLLQDEDVALSLWLIQHYTDTAIQGTTLNESLHSALSRSKAGNIISASYETLNMMLGTFFYKHNQR